MDPNFEYDGNILQAMYTMSAEGCLLHEKWLQTCMRTEANPNRSLTAALAASATYTGAELKLYPRAVRAGIEEADAMVKRLSSGEIILRSAQSTPFLKSVAAKLESFVDYEFVFGNPSEDVKLEKGQKLLQTKVGSDFVKAHLALLVSGELKATALSDLKTFTSFRHILSTEDTKNVASIRDGLLKTVPAAKASSAKPKPVAASSSTSSVKAAAIKAKKPESAENLKATALAMLRAKKAA
eukprot:6491768-Amphidinium_carterae.3